MGHSVCKSSHADRDSQLIVAYLIELMGLLAWIKSLLGGEKSWNADRDRRDRDL